MFETIHVLVWSLWDQNWNRWLREKLQLSLDEWHRYINVEVSLLSGKHSIAFHNDMLHMSLILSLRLWVSERPSRLWNGIYSICSRSERGSIPYILWCPGAALNHEGSLWIVATSCVADTITSTVVHVCMDVLSSTPLQVTWLSKRFSLWSAIGWCIQIGVQRTCMQYIYCAYI